MKNLVPRRSHLGGSLFDGFENFFRPILDEYDVPMRCDVREDENNYVIESELPGIDKSNIEISLKDGYLTVTATKTAEESANEGKYLRREIKYGSSSRSFYVGYGIDEKDISAKFTNGILKLTFPKATAGKNGGKKISIE
jgi:HSP20 family molecular chaperone IbpA